jgi:hypothetical protein
VNTLVTCLCWESNPENLGKVVGGR